MCAKKREEPHGSKAATDRWHLPRGRAHGYCEVDGAEEAIYYTHQKHIHLDVSRVTVTRGGSTI
jgi:hypothetical protein